MNPGNFFTELKRSNVYKVADRTPEKCSAMR